MTGATGEDAKRRREGVLDFERREYVDGMRYGWYCWLMHGIPAYANIGCWLIGRLAFTLDAAVESGALDIGDDICCIWFRLLA